MSLLSCRKLLLFGAALLLWRTVLATPLQFSQYIPPAERRFWPLDQLYKTDLNDDAPFMSTIAFPHISSSELTDAGRDLYSAQRDHHKSLTPRTLPTALKEPIVAGSRLLFQHMDVVVSSTQAYFRTTEFYKNITALLPNGDWDFG